MNKTIGIIVVVVVIIGGVFLFTRHSSAPTTGTSSPATSAPSESTNPAASSTTTPPTVATSYTLAQVAQHAGSASCWSAINGNVYDLTNWIGQHPGGAQRILSICGKDGSAAFNGQHANDPRPHQILATMQIGVLAQ